MYDIDEIMDMLDWNNTEEVQQRGIELARNIKCINAFILPLGKNVWENCAKILVTKTDEVLRPYLSELLECIEDINWPGAEIILERLQNFSETEWLCTAFKECVKIASASDRDMWLVSMADLLENEKLKEMLPIEMINMLEAKRDYYLNYDE